MRLARIETPTGPRTVTATPHGWATVVSIFDPRPTGETFAADAPLLAPIEPGQLIGVSHPADSDGVHRVQGWLKAVRGIAGPGDAVERAGFADVVAAEGELAVVIGCRATALTPENALDHVLGYTIANDVTNLEPRCDEIFFASKSGRNYTPLGPWIETDIAAPDALGIEVAIAGETVRRSTTAALPATVADILVALTTVMTLEPGDVVLTGSPSTDAVLRPGAGFAITIDAIGTLEGAVA